MRADLVLSKCYFVKISEPNRSIWSKNPAKRKCRFYRRMDFEECRRMASTSHL